MPNSDKEVLLDSFLDKGVVEGKHLEKIHQLHQAQFRDKITEVLENYGLQEQLQKAGKNGTKVNILDIGCGEGLYLHDVAQMLDERGLAARVNYYGIDINPEMITVAEQFAKLAKPPRPYLRFYCYDATEPLENSPIAKIHGVHQFDFIYANNLLELLPEARQHLERFYTALKPGGVIYLHSLVLHKGADGWLPIHAALEPFDHIFMGKMAQLNPGTEVAQETATWLREMGAQQVRQKINCLKADKNTPEGRMQLSLRISTLHERMAPMLIRQGLLKQADYDKIWARVSSEPPIDGGGQTSLVNTLARKPLD